MEREQISPASAEVVRPLVPEVLGGLGAVGRVARALVAGGPLPQLSDRALAELRDALGLDIAVLYLPAAGSRPALARYLSSAAGSATARARDEVSFDEEAWRLAVAGGVPLVFQEEASWLGPNPFEPAADYWLALPLTSVGRLLGVVMAASAKPFALDPVATSVLTLICDLLTAGIARARLRQEVERMELERERMQLAAEVHDGLAQDLALARRELALLESDPPEEVERESRRRLVEAVDSAHGVVRARLKELAVPVSLGGIGDAVAEICERFQRRGVPVRAEIAGPAAEATPETAAAIARILSEALANIERHAEARRVDVGLRLEDERLTLTVTDDGEGFDVEKVAGADRGHLGLTLMRQRAHDAGAELRIQSSPGAGTRITVQTPLRVPGRGSSLGLDA